jgi:hypothetical protein
MKLLQTALHWLALLATACLFAVQASAEPGNLSGTAPADRLRHEDYTAFRAHPDDEKLFAAILAKLPTFTVEQGGVLRRYYVYEGDLLLTRDEVRRALTSNPAREGGVQAFSPELIVSIVGGKPQFWPKTNRTLTYAIDRRSFPADQYEHVSASMKKAAADWSAACANCGLTIRHDTSLDGAPREGTATFIVRYVPTQSEFIALAFFPNAPVEQRYLYVFPPYLTTQYDKIGVFRHEIGHVLGYRHEQIAQEAGCWQDEDGQWKRLSDYDPLSVMHYYCGQTGQLKLELSQTDRSSHTLLYSGARLPSTPIEHGGIASPPPGNGALMGAADFGSKTPEPKQGLPLPRLNVSFVGGVVARDMAMVLARLAEAPSNLPIVTRTVAKPGDTPASLLKELGVPVTGISFERLLRTLNGQTFDARRLRIGDSVILPDVRVWAHRTVRLYSPDVASEQSEKRAILAGWLGKRVVAQSVNGLDRVEFDAYDASVHFASDAALKAALDRLIMPKERSLRSRNVTIDGDFAHPEPVLAYAGADNYELLCRVPRGAPSGAALPPPLFSYGSLLDADNSVAALVERSPAALARPVVYIVDTQVIDNPALFGAEEAPAASPRPPLPDWRCNWVDFVEALHHGTHMAGIIASRNNQGFLGLAPTSRIISLPWLRASADTPPKLLPVAGSEHVLAETMSRTSNNTELSVYLFASQFKKFTADQLDGAGQLHDLDTRFSTTEAHRAVPRARQLLIVAAGQAERAGVRPTRLTRFTPYAPQNMGDLENVVVVTACGDCHPATMSLMAGANYGEEPQSVVHLIAPGGEPLPAWVAADGVSSAAGTSQAAAYVSGVAAAMIARYPNAYTRADLLKRRLLLTAWPALPGQPANDLASEVGAGLVDYQRAQLDPTKSWLNDASGWNQVRIRKWSVPLQLVDENGNERIVSAIQVLRLIKLADGSSYAGYFKGSAALGNGAVERFGPVTAPNPNVVLELCGGRSLRLEDIVELIPASINAGAEASCAN